MQPLVLITYLALVLAVAGQAVDVQKEMPAAPPKPQVHDVPNQDDDAQDTAPDAAKRIYESAKNRAESVQRPTR